MILTSVGTHRKKLHSEIRIFRYQTAAFAVAMALALLSSYPVQAEEEPGRYRLFASNNLVFMLDTIKGRVWKYREPLNWVAMEYTTNSTGNPSASPGGTTSAMDRWKEESESRKLELLQPETVDQK